MSGSASRHWRRHKLSSVALVPLGAWFLFALLALPDPGYASARGWLQQPASALLMLAFGWCALWHSAQGVRAVLDDYATGAWHARLAALSRILHLAAALAIGWALWALRAGGSP